MSASIPCTCPVKTSFKNPQNMRVVDRNCNYSYFETPKGGRHYSDYSTLVCIGVGSDGQGCGMSRRSKDHRIVLIPDLSENP